MQRWHHHVNDLVNQTQTHDMIAGTQIASDIIFQSLKNSLLLKQLVLLARELGTVRYGNSNALFTVSSLNLEFVHRNIPSLLLFECRFGQARDRHDKTNQQMQIAKQFTFKVNLNLSRVMRMGNCLSF